VNGRLKGKVAVVTGAARGIGAATASRFCAEGAAVICVDIDGDAVETTAKRLAEAGGTADAVQADVSTREGNERMVAHALAAYGGLDVVHANAAVQRIARLEETSDNDWDALFSVNLRGVGLGVRAALPALRDRGGGSVIVTASVLGIVGDPDLPAYGAMKGGLRSLCRSLAAAHGPENIRFNTICPGDVETPMLEEFFASQPDGAAARERILQCYPLRRFATPEDVANVAVFLASDEAAYLTGIDITVEGGLLAQVYLPAPAGGPAGPAPAHQEARAASGAIERHQPP
jgi:NAD(P)-dependent dehydrogenase (short-subunit alcohol dehydrogenase family)